MSERYFGLLIWGGIFAVTALVCLAIGAQMKRAGLSTKPVWWFAGFIVLIGAPQVAGHFWLLGRAGSERAFQSEQDIFGDGVDPDLIRDIGPAFGPVFADASPVKMAVRRTGETVTAARFGRDSQANEAVGAYLRFIGLEPVARPAAQGGFVAPRANDVVVARAVGPWFIAWSGANEEMIAARQRALGLEPKAELPRGPMMLLTAAMVILAAVYFFRGAAWAGRIDPAPGAAPVPESELALRLEALGLTRESGGQWSVTWEPLAGRKQRISVDLDGARHAARVTDYVAAGYSKGASGVWRNWTGIVFFQTGSHQRIKKPVIDAVTGAGWYWQPAIWSGLPSWLAWLTG